MIEKLKKKIFWSIELSSMALLLVILLALNGVNLWKNEQEDWELMRTEAKFFIKEDRENEETELKGIDKSEDGQRRKEGGDRRNSAVRALLRGELGILCLSSDGEVEEALGFFEDYQDEEIKETIKKVEEDQAEAGRLDGMKYVLAKLEDGTRTIVCLDTEYLVFATLQMLLLSLLVLGIAAVFFAILASKIAQKIVFPVSQTMESQKGFIADASHELKTPITVINANISLLEKEIGSNQWLGYIKEEGRRMTSLIENLLKISKLEYEKEYKANTELAIDYDAVRSVEKTALPFESLAFENGCRLEMDLPNSLPVKGYPADLEQLTGILLDNAIKYCNKGGIVKISLVAKEKVIELTVENTGEEIPPDQLAHIFDRFYKRDSSRKYESRSFGLGLAIAKAIAEKNKAKLEAYSKSDKTYFICRIPFAK